MGRQAQTLSSELLLNAANRAAQEDLSVFYFRPCELVNLNQWHLHGTPAFDFGSWDRIRFMYVFRQWYITSLLISNK